MKSTFKCWNCNITFESEGQKVEFMDPIYGACSRNISICPDCMTEASEYKKPKPAKILKSDLYCNGNCNCCGQS